MGRGDGIDRSAPEDLLDELAERRESIDSISQMEIARTDSGYVAHCEIEQVGDALHLQAQMEIVSGRYQGKWCVLDIPVDAENESYRQLCKLVGFAPESFLLPAIMSLLCQGTFEGVVVPAGTVLKIERLSKATFPPEEEFL